MPQEQLHRYRLFFAQMDSSMGKVLFEGQTERTAPDEDSAMEAVVDDFESVHRVKKNFNVEYFFITAVLSATAFPPSAMPEEIAK